MFIELLNGDESKWTDLVEYALTKATHIEFNILYSDHKLSKFLKDNKESNVQLISKKEKIYSSGKTIRLKLTGPIVDSVRCKTFSDYRNWYLEDPSFYIDDVEFIATITHENQIYIDPKYVDLNQFPNFNLEHRQLEEKRIGFFERMKAQFWI